MSAVNFKALVVDDELPIRALMSAALTQRGFECELASNGDEALDRLDRGKFDLVVTDLAMPKRNGHNLCVRILAMQNRPRLAVLTGVAEPRLVKDLEVRGVDIVRQKPIDLRVLADELHMCVKQRKGAASNGAGTPTAKGPAATNCPISAAAPNLQANHQVCLLLRDRAKAVELCELVGNESTSCVVTDSSDHLCHVLESQRIDLLIIQNKLGGFLSGTDIVSRLNQQLIRPRVILLDDLTDDVKKAADDIGIDLVHSLSDDLHGLTQEAVRILADNADRDAFIPPLARHLVKDFADIPPLPQLVVKLAGYLSIPLNKISIEELAKDISTDSKVTTDLLKLTNGSRSVLNQVTSVQQAVNLHGPKRTISLVLSAATMNVQSYALNQWNEAHRQWYQKRSVVTAATAATIAAKFENVSPDTAFILGLVQDIGCLVLSQKFGTRYDLIVRRVCEVGRSHLHQLEMESFDVHHGHVSAALLQKWCLPQSLIRPVVLHHDVDATEHLSKADAAFVRVTQIGEALANALEVPHSFRNHRLNQLMSHYHKYSLAERDAALSESVCKAHELCEVFKLPLPEVSELEDILRHSSNEVEYAPQA